MSMYFWILHLPNPCWRTLKLEMNSHSLRARQLTLAMAIFPGYMASMSWQQMAPVPSCSICFTSSCRVEFTQASRSDLGTKKAPSIMPILWFSFIQTIYIMNLSDWLISMTLTLQLLFCLVAGNTAQKFVYNAKDTLTVQANSLVHLSLQLTTTADEYLSESELEAELQMSSAGEVMPYDILYFTYQEEGGQNCYQSWVLEGSIPCELNCSQLLEEDFSDLPQCCRYSGCSTENITLRISLSEQLYRESYLVIENNNPGVLLLQTAINLSLSSNNIWFYWGVGLTCLLLISLAIFTGVVFYWMLRYKKAKKMFEQFKLTEENIKQE